CQCPVGFPKPPSQLLDESPGYLGIGGYERPVGGRGEDKAVRVLKSDYVGRPRWLIEEPHLPEQLTSRYLRERPPVAADLGGTADDQVEPDTRLAFPDDRFTLLEGPFF